MDFEDMVMVVLFLALAAAVIVCAVVGFVTIIVWISRRVSRRQREALEDTRPRGLGGVRGPALTRLPEEGSRLKAGLQTREDGAAEAPPAKHEALDGPRPRGPQRGGAVEAPPSQTRGNGAAEVPPAKHGTLDGPRPRGPQRGGAGRRIAEFLTRNALYAGILCAFVAVVGAIVHYRDVLPAWMKILALLLAMAAMYLAGRWLRLRRGYPRTGLALMLLSAAWLPLNYLAAILFKVIDPGAALYMSWGVVLLACALAYAEVAWRLRERSFATLTILALLCSMGFFLWDVNASRITWQASYAIAVFVMLGISTLRRHAVRLYRTPALWLSFALACAVTGFTFFALPERPAVTDCAKLWYRFAFLAWFFHVFLLRVRRTWVAPLVLAALFAATIMGWVGWDREINVWPPALSAVALTLALLTLRDAFAGTRAWYRVGLGISLFAALLLAMCGCCEYPVWQPNIIAMAILTVVCFARFGAAGFSPTLVLGWLFAVLAVVTLARIPDAPVDRQLWFVCGGLSLLAVVNRLLPDKWRSNPSAKWMWYGLAAVIILPGIALPIILDSPPTYLARAALTATILWLILFLTYRDRFTAALSVIAAQAAWFACAAYVSFLNRDLTPLVTVGVVALGLSVYHLYDRLKSSTLDVGRSALDVESPVKETHRFTPGLPACVSDTLLFTLVYGTLFFFRHFVWTGSSPTGSNELAWIALLGALGASSGLLRRSCTRVRQFFLTSIAAPLLVVAAYAWLVPDLVAKSTREIDMLSWMGAALCLAAAICPLMKRRTAGGVHQFFATAFLLFYCFYATDEWPVPWWPPAVLLGGHVLMAFAARNTFSTISAQAASVLLAVTVGYHISPRAAGVAHGLVFCGGLFIAAAIAWSFFQTRRTTRWLAVSGCLAWIAAYYLYMYAFHVDRIAALLWLPAAAIIAAAHAGRRLIKMPVGFRNFLQTIGCLIYFLPLYIITVGDRDLSQHALFMLGVGVLFASAVWMKNRWLFHGALALIVIDGITLLVQVVKFGGAPWPVYFAIASVLLLGIGLLFEKNLNRMLKRQLYTMKDAYRSFFEGWE